MDRMLQQELMAKARAIMNHSGFMDKTRQERNRMMEVMVQKGLSRHDLEALKQELYQLQNQQRQKQQVQKGENKPIDNGFVARTERDSHAFNLLDNNALAQILVNLRPREVIDNCNLNTRFADLCRNPDVFKFLLRKHYPYEFYTNDPRQQYIAITEGIETMYNIPIINPAYEQDARYTDEENQIQYDVQQEQERIQKKIPIEVGRPMKVGNPSEPEYTDSWSTGNTSADLAHRLLHHPIFLGWVKRNPEFLAEILSIKHVTSARFATLAMNKHLVVDRIFKLFLADYRVRGLDAILQETSVKEEIEKYNKLIKSRGSAETIMMIERFPDFLQEVLIGGKSNSYTMSPDGVIFSIKGNPIPGGTEAWAMINPGLFFHPVKPFKTREELASYMATEEYGSIDDTLYDTFLTHINSNPDLVYLSEAPEEVIKKSPGYQQFLKDEGLFPFTSENVYNYVMTHDQLWITGTDTPYTFRIIRF